MERTLLSAAFDFAVAFVFRARPGAARISARVPARSARFLITLL